MVARDHDMASEEAKMSFAVVAQEVAGEESVMRDDAVAKGEAAAKEKVAGKDIVARE